MLLQIDVPIAPRILCHVHENDLNHLGCIFKAIKTEVPVHDVNSFQPCDWQQNSRFGVYGLLLVFSLVRTRSTRA